MVLNYKQLGERIRNTRLKRGMTQQKLSEIIDCTPTYISYIENGRKGMALETFIQIANALNASADELLMDSLENTIIASNHELADIVSDCSNYELRILIDNSKSLKFALRKHAVFSAKRYF